MENKKDPGLAAVIELLAGFFGFLGVGHIYIGNFNRGVTYLLGYWALVLFEVVVYIFISFITLGCGSVLILPIIAINIVIVILSAKMVFDEAGGRES